MPTNTRKVFGVGLNLLRRAGSYVFKPYFQGVGSVLCLHSVRPRRELSQVFAYRAMCNSLEFLRELIEILRARGVDIVSVDEVARRLQTSDQRRFVAFTFDDGFKDNLQHVVPLFQKYDLPLAIYVVPGLIDGTAILWWHFLAELVARSDKLEIIWDDKPYACRCESLLAKDAAFERVANLIRFGDQSSAMSRVARLFEANGIDWKGRTSEVILNWTEIVDLSRQEGITIGAHSLTHRTLNLLSPEEVRQETAGSKRAIEAKLGRPVEHFSYPFGGRNAVNRDVLELGRTSGFKTMLTTRAANVFPEHKEFLHGLPRLSVSGNRENMAFADARLNGMEAALARRGQRVVVD